VLRANAQLAAAQSRYQLAKREWVPDPTVSIQADHYNAGSQIASEVSGGVSISLPWFSEKKYSAAEREALDQVTAAQDTLDGVKNEALGRLKDQLQKSKHFITMLQSGPRDFRTRAHQAPGKP